MNRTCLSPMKTMVPELLRNEFHNSSAVIESDRPQTKYSVSENLYQQQMSLVKKKKKRKTLNSWLLYTTGASGPVVAN